MPHSVSNVVLLVRTWVVAGFFACLQFSFWAQRLGYKTGCYKYRVIFRQRVQFLKVNVPNMDLGINHNPEILQEEDEEGDRRSSLVAVAVDKDKNSKYAVKWALDNLVCRGETLVLLHVRPPILTIPTPMGNRVPVTHVCDDVMATYMQQVESQTDNLLLPYLHLCNIRKVQAEIKVIVDNDIPMAIVDYISNFNLRKIVMGSSSRNIITRKFMAPDVPARVAKISPSFCTVYVISKGKLSSVKSAVSLESISGSEANIESPCNFQGEADPLVEKSTTFLNFNNNKSKMGIRMITDDSYEPPTSLDINSGASSLQSTSIQSQLGDELEKLELELKQLREIYSRACDEAISAQNAKEMHIQRVEELKKLEAAKSREEFAGVIVAEERARRDADMKEAEATAKIAEIEEQQRRLADFIAMTKSKSKHEDVLPLAGQRIKQYSIEEIEAATDFFSESNKIGEGSYGSVYKCTLDYTLVAVKALHPDSTQGWKQFQQEVEILGRIQHPHIVLLLGACPEVGCLVYEYMSNGSLEDRLFRTGATQPLPWFARFRIASEIATGLLYLHSSKPKPLVHRDLKPANILLDQNFVSKIGDAGLAKLVPPSVSGSITMYRNTTTSGTFCYIDPEYQRTGTLGTKSDLYAFGVVLLQLLTAKRPMGIAYDVERAIEKGSFKSILDPSIRDWPVREALELAKLALRCVEMRRRDRPDLETVVLPELQRLKANADSRHVRIEDGDATPPRYSFCPILQFGRKVGTGEDRPTKISCTKKVRRFCWKIHGS